MFIFFTRVLLTEEKNLIDNLRSMFVKHEILRKKVFSETPFSLRLKHYHS